MTTTKTTVTIRCVRPIPARKGWARDKKCRVLAGCYETVGPPSREIYIREQIGHVEGWHYFEWDGATPLTAKMFIRVEI